MPASHCVAMDMSETTADTDEEQMDAGEGPDDEIDALLARANAELAGAGVCELDDQALIRRAVSILRHRRSEEDMTGAGEASERFAPTNAALDPPVRFVRRERGIRLPPVGPGQRPEQQAQLNRVEPEPERRSLIVSSVYPSGWATTPQARIVRWSRKRKAPGDVAGETGPRGESAKAFVGAVAYI
jgi:hypothetical protein